MSKIQGVETASGGTFSHHSSHQRCIYIFSSKQYYSFIWQFYSKAYQVIFPIIWQFWKAASSWVKSNSNLAAIVQEMYVQEMMRLQAYPVFLRATPFLNDVYLKFLQYLFLRSINYNSKGVFSACKNEVCPYGSRLSTSRLPNYVLHLEHQLIMLTHSLDVFLKTGVLKRRCIILHCRHLGRSTAEHSDRFVWALALFHLFPLFQIFVSLNSSSL